MQFKTSRKLIALALSIVMLSGFFAPLSVSADGNHWAQKQLNDWQKRGLLKGDRRGLRPNGQVTRAEFVSFVNRVKGFEAVSNKIDQYTDVAKTDWYRAEFAKALAAGYIAGVSEDKMDPKKPITRQEAMVILQRLEALNSDTEIPASVNDKATVAAWANKGVAACINNGYITGRDGGVDPLGNITRAETVVMLDRVDKDERIFGFAGTYDSSKIKGTEIGSVTITVSNVTLRGITVKKDVTVASSVKGGVTLLDGITVNGNVNVNGGEASKRVQLENVAVKNNINVDSANHTRVQLVGTTSAAKLVVKSDSIIDVTKLDEKNIPTVEIKNTVKENGVVEFVGKFNKITNESKNIEIKLDGDVKVLEVAENTKVSGNAHISELVKAEGVKFTNASPEGEKKVTIGNEKEVKKDAIVKKEVKEEAKAPESKYYPQSVAGNDVPTTTDVATKLDPITSSAAGLTVKTTTDSATVVKTVNNDEQVITVYEGDKLVKDFFNEVVFTSTNDLEVVSSHFVNKDGKILGTDDKITLDSKFVVVLKGNKKVEYTFKK